MVFGAYPVVKAVNGHVRSYPSISLITRLGEDKLTPLSINNCTHFKRADCVSVHVIVEIQAIHAFYCLTNQHCLVATFSWC